MSLLMALGIFPTLFFGWWTAFWGFAALGFWGRRWPRFTEFALHAGVAPAALVAGSVGVFYGLPADLYIVVAMSVAIVILVASRGSAAAFAISGVGVTGASWGALQAAGLWRSPFVDTFGPPFGPEAAGGGFYAAAIFAAGIAVVVPRAPARALDAAVAGAFVVAAAALGSGCFDAPRSQLLSARTAGLPVLSRLHGVAGVAVVSVTSLDVVVEPPALPNLADCWMATHQEPRWGCTLDYVGEPGFSPEALRLVGRPGGGETYIVEPGRVLGQVGGPPLRWRDLGPVAAPPRVVGSAVMAALAGFAGRWVPGLPRDVVAAARWALVALGLAPVLTWFYVTRVA